jgi:hypothetical protein
MVCGHVFRRERKATVVIRHSDGEWQFVCGEHDHPEDCFNFEIVGLEHLVERQPDLAEIGELKPGLMAELSPSGWSYSHHDD